MLLGGFLIGLLVGAGHNAKNTTNALLRTYGIDRDVVKRHREAAKILHDLVHVNDLSDMVPVLPTSMQKRVEDWLEVHNRVIREGK